MPFNKESASKAGKKSKRTGVQNVHTTAFKDLIMNAYLALEKDPKYGIVKWAKENQTEFYKIASKLIPVQVTANVNEVKQIIFTPHEQLPKGHSNGTLPEKRKEQSENSDQ